MYHKLIKCLILGITALLSLQLTGCKENITSKPFNPPPEKQKSSYNATYHAAFDALPEGASADNACLIGNTLYYSNTETTEGIGPKEPDNTPFIYFTEIDNPNPQKLPITFKEKESLYRINPGADGSLYLLTSETTSDEQAQYLSMDYFLKQIKLDGTLINTIALSSFFDSEDDPYIQYFVMDNDGNIVFTNGTSKIFALNPEGALLFTINIDNWIDSMAVSGEGKVIAVSFFENGLEMKEIDFTAKAFKKTYTLSNFENEMNLMKKSQKNGIFISTTSSLFHYDFEKEKLSVVLNWQDCDINGNEIRFVSELEDKTIFAVSTSYATGIPFSNLIFLTQTDS